MRHGFRLCGQPARTVRVDDVCEAVVSDGHDVSGPIDVRVKVREERLAKDRIEPVDVEHV